MNKNKIIGVFFVAVLLLIGLNRPTIAQTNPPTNPPAAVLSIHIGMLRLVSSTRIGRTLFNYTYAASVTNSSGTVFVANAVATVVSTNSATKVLQGNLSIGDVPSLGTVPSSGTFVIQQDRAQPFNPSDLLWSVTGNPITGAIPPLDPGLAGAATLAGIDANGNGVRDDVERFILIQFSQADERTALFQYSKAFQELLTSSDQKSVAVQGASDLQESLECLASKGYPLSDASEVEAVYASTHVRAQAYLHAAALVSGEYFEGHSAALFGESCK